MIKGPPVSVLINAYGRTWILSEAIAAVLGQDYHGDIELVIVSDFHLQHLVLPSPTEQIRGSGRTVAVHNLRPRFGSLGEKRNAGFALCSHPIVITADDDDIMLPWSVSSLMEAYQKTFLPTWCRSYIHTLGWPAPTSYEVMRASSAQHGVISREHHRQLGGFRAFSTKDDVDFRTRALEKYGPRCEVDLPLPEYVYRWGTGTHHLAGNSVCAVSWGQAHRTALEDIQSGREPSGEVLLKPKLHHDYVGDLMRHLSPKEIPAGYAHQVEDRAERS